MIARNQRKSKKFEARIKALGHHIKAVQAEQAFLVFQAARRTYFAQVKIYKAAVEEFVAAIDERREQMAIFGAKADEIMSKGGKKQNISQTLLMAASVMETKVLIDTAVTAGQEAQSVITAARSNMGKHRGPYASESYDIGAWIRPKWDMKRGPDQNLVYVLNKRVNNWLAGASNELGDLSGQIGRPSNEYSGEATGIMKLLEQVGIIEY